MRLFDSLEYYARTRPETLFAIGPDRQLTYAEADVEANQIGNALVDAGLGVGDRFAYLSKNSIDYALMYYGASKVGCAPVPLNYRLAPAEWRYIANDAGAKLVIARGELANAFDTVRSELDAKRFMQIDAQGLDGWEEYRSWVGGQPSTRSNREITPEADLYQMYTSGTTGRPKGAVLPHKAIVANVAQFTAGLSIRPGIGERVLVVAPMYHAAAGISAMASISAGMTAVIHEDFVPADVVDTLSTQDIVITTLVPAMIQACLVFVPDIAERDYSALKFIVYGASPIAEDTLRTAMKTFGCDFGQGFGMTETTAIATILSEADHRRALAEKPELLLSCGRAVLGTEIKIADAHGNEVARGEVGEIHVRGPQLMRGYWNMKEESEKALAGGWMHTGDAAIMDEEGYVYIQDRIKDMIVSGGENIYPREVENALFEHPSIADAAVIGVPDEKFGEAVLAVLVLREGQSVSEDEVIDFCRSRLGSYKIPRKITFIDELPRNASGKVLKKDLREPYWEGHERRVG